jgi:hypothetical protein
MSRSYISSPPKYLHGVWWDSFRILKPGYPYGAETFLKSKIFEFVKNFHLVRADWTI